MKIDDVNILIEKAKTRKDGVYSFQGYLYVVKDNKFIAFADYHGSCFKIIGCFVVSIGNVKKRYEIKQKLIEWLKSQ